MGWKQGDGTGVRWAAVLAVLGLGLVSGCGGDDTSLDGTSAEAEAEVETETEVEAEPTEDTASTAESTPTTAGAATTVESAPSTTEPAGEAPEGAVPLASVLTSGSGEPQTIEAGRYSDGALTGPGVLAVDEPVDAVWYEEGAILILRDPSWAEDFRGALFLSAPLGVIPPEEAGTHQPHEPAVPDVAVALPDDLGAYLGSIEQVEIVTSGSIEAAGSTATWYDVTVADGSETFDCNRPEQCVGLLAQPNGVSVFQIGATYRIYELEALPGLVAWAGLPGDVDASDMAVFDDLLADLATAG